VSALRSHRLVKLSHFDIICPQAIENVYTYLEYQKQAKLAFPVHKYRAGVVSNK